MKIQINFLRLDFQVQTLFFVINTLFITLGFYAPLFWILMLLLQIAIGFYQLWVSNLVHLLRKEFDGRIRHLRKIHFITSHIFLIVLGIAGLIDFQPTDSLLLTGIIAVPQLFAYLYFWLTWKDYYGRKNYLDSRPTIFAY
jgi:uncharacterized membrane protein